MADEEKKQPAADEAAEPKSEKKPKGKKKPEGKLPEKKAPENPDFLHLVRISSTDLQGSKKVVVALTGIKGVGNRVSYMLADRAGVPRMEKIGNLKEEQVQALQSAIDDFVETAPGWLFNRQNDYDTGDDTHLIGPDVGVFLREDLNRLKKIRTYRGVRHESGHPVRGQRTRSNGRTGLTVGVQRKKEQPAGKKE